MGLAEIMALAPNRSFSKFDTRPGYGENSGNADTIRAMLLDAGWKDAGTMQATARIEFPLGFPDYLTGVLPIQRVAATFGKAGFPASIYRWFYPWEHNPTGFDGQNFIYGVLLGSTGGQSAANLADVMGGGMFIPGLYNGIFTPQGITFTAGLLGTAGNNYDFEGNGSNSGGSGLSIGGGWVLESQCQADKIPGSTNTTKTKITIDTWGVSQNRLHILVEVDGMTPQGMILKYGEWQAYANNFSALFFTETPFGAGDVYVFNTWLHCGSLYIPPELSLAKVGFILQGGFTQVTTGVGNAFADPSTGVDGKEMLHGGWGPSGIAFVYYHYEMGSGSEHLQTRMGKALMCPAMLMMPTRQGPNALGVVDEARVVGYMWDSFLVTEYHAPGSVIVQEGQPYRAIFCQTTPPTATVFLAWPTKPPDQGVEPPIPKDFVGTCNVFGTGATRLSGDPFTQDLVGRALYINHAACRVVSVEDADHLTLAVAGGVFPGATYNTAG